ncbi:MAG TPA: PAS domain S-box protein, partial [Stenomitos sp.]
VDLQQRSQFLTALHNNGVIRGQECHLRTRTGRVRTVLYSAEQVEIEGQACLISTINDISDRRQAEEALRHAEEKYRSIFENSLDGIFQSTPEGQFLSANPALARMYGYKSPEILLREVTDIAHQLYLDPAQRHQFMEIIEQQGYITNFEALTFRRDGSTIWILIDARVVRDANGCALYYEGTVKDTTDKRVAEEALKYAKAEAEAANRAKSTFFSNMSHELRTPLNAILGFTQVLNRDQTLSPVHREHLDIINRSGEHLLDLINGVLDMAKIEAGRIEVNRSSFDLFSLLATLENMFRMKAQSKGIYLGFERAADVPQFIYTDEGKLRQILINLIGNAIKFTDHGYVVVKVTLTDTSQNHHTQHLKFEVQDTGAGIPANEKETIFEAFVQGKLVRQPQTGTGLGLPISREFIHLLGGEISVQSTLNQGTCFWFHLPAEAKNTLPLSTPLPTQQVIGLAEGEPSYRLLVVDDSLESRQLMRSLLEPLGFVIREAKNGKEAIQVWQEWSPHLIWMDMQMPVMDGYEATRQIQQRSSHDPARTAPIIIALTASVLENEKESILAAGCNDFVQKPFREACIFQALQQHLGVQFVSQVLTPPTFPSPAADYLPSDHAETLEHLKCMPPDWITQVYRAAQEVNNSALMHYIEQIPERHHTLAHTLASLVHHFRCDIIVELTRQAL